MSPKRGSIQRCMQTCTYSELTTNLMVCCKRSHPTMLYEWSRMECNNFGYVMGFRLSSSLKHHKCSPVLLCCSECHNDTINLLLFDVVVRWRLMKRQTGHRLTWNWSILVERPRVNGLILGCHPSIIASFKQWTLVALWHAPLNEILRERCRNIMWMHAEEELKFENPKRAWRS